jgi:tetratricopeptide (TPR) repeat protein
VARQNRRATSAWQGAARFLVAVTCLGALTLSAIPAAVAQDAVAQDQAERRRDLARTLFAEGVQLVQERRFEEAESRFREAMANRNAPTIRYNLASVLFEQGEYPEAATLIASVLSDETTSAEIREHTSALRAQLEERAGFVRLDVTGGEDAAVALDGFAIQDRDAEIPLTPGAHVATASRGEREVARAEVELGLGERRVISLDAREPELLAEGALTPQAAEAPLLEQWWFWTAVGGGVAVVAVVIGVAVAASSSGGVEAPVQGNFEPGVLRW